MESPKGKKLQKVDSCKGYLSQIALKTCNQIALRNIQLLVQTEKRICNSDFSFLPMPLVSSVKYQSKVSKSLFVGGQCLDRVMLCLKPFDFNDFRFGNWRNIQCSLTTISFVLKNLKLNFHWKTQGCSLQHCLPHALHCLVAVKSIVLIFQSNLLA